MNPMRMTLILVVAAVCAIGLALIVRTIAHKPTPPAVAAAAPAQKPMAQVLVAKRDLKIGTRLAAGDIGWQAWPADVVNPAFITDGSTPAPASVTTADKAKVAAKKTETAVLGGGGGPMEALYGSIVREPILASEPVIATKLVRGGDGGYMAVVLRPGMRAMAVPVTVETGAGGFILPGDHIDLLQSKSQAAQGGGGNVVVTRTVMSNVRVLAIDQSTAITKDAQAMVGSVATLEIPNSYVETMARAKAQGDLVMALRSYADAGGPPGGGKTAESGAVRIFRNGQATDVMVTR